MNKTKSTTTVMTARGILLRCFGFGIGANTLLLFAAVMPLDLRTTLSNILNLEIFFRSGRMKLKAL
jgi:hypothetical protein